MNDLLPASQFSSFFNIALSSPYFLFTHSIDEITKLPFYVTITEDLFDNYSVLILYLHPSCIGGLSNPPLCSIFQIHSTLHH